MALETVTSRKKKLWSFDQLIAEMPEANQPTELWDGELIMTPSPTSAHQAVVARLVHDLSEFVSQHQLGQVYFAPLDVVFTQRRVVQPDIIFISQAQQAIIQDRIRGVPDLIIEVVSIGTWHRDCVDKRTLYEQFGVSEYWIVDPEAETIEVLALQEGGYRLIGRFVPGQAARSLLLTGFEIFVNEILGL
jgi:Uma2 family endonuclease